MQMTFNFLTMNALHQMLVICEKF